MSNTTHGGKRPGSGRPATGRTGVSITLSVSPETKEKMKALGLSRKASAFFEKQVADFFALCKQSADFEVSLQNGIFRTVSAERFVIYGETVEELLQNLENRGDNSDLACERRKLLGYAYKYGEWDTDSNNNNPACRPFILKKDGKIVDIV